MMFPWRFKYSLLVYLHEYSKCDIKFFLIVLQFFKALGSSFCFFSALVRKPSSSSSLARLLGLLLFFEVDKAAGGL